MRAVVQRVRRASVQVHSETVGAINAGLLVFLGVERGDGAADLDYLRSKILGLRIFADDMGKMNRSVVEVGGGILVISQFTLFGDVRRGRRPSFEKSEDPAIALAMYEEFAKSLSTEPGLIVQTGIFGADMIVSAEVDGPVTILLDSRKLF